MSHGPSSLAERVTDRAWLCLKDPSMIRGFSMILNAPSSFRKTKSESPCLSQYGASRARVRPVSSVLERIGLAGGAFIRDSSLSPALRRGVSSHLNAWTGESQATPESRVRRRSRTRGASCRVATHSFGPSPSDGHEWGRSQYYKNSFILRKKSNCF